MLDPTVTLSLPPAVYEELQQRHRRLIRAEAGLALGAAMGAGEALPPDLAGALDALDTLDGETLRRVRRRGLSTGCPPPTCGSMS